MRDEVREETAVLDQALMDALDPLREGEIAYRLPGAVIAVRSVVIAERKQADAEIGRLSERVEALTRALELILARTSTMERDPDTPVDVRLFFGRPSVVLDANSAELLSEIGAASGDCRLNPKGRDE